MRPSLLALAAQMMVIAWPAFAQAPQAAPPPQQTPQAAPSQAAPAAQAAAPPNQLKTGATARPASPRSTRPAPPIFRPQRQPRPYSVCRQRARERGLRGGDRRAFLVRCQLGYGPRAPARR
jgi:hypothetical protein